MKKIINKLFKEKFCVIFGLAIGIIIMGGISYGVNQIQSSSVSYTRDGKTMSVEQAIDDLIVKVNNKNEHVSVPMDLGKTLQLKADEENVTWESSNENIATVDSNGLVTAKSLGTAKITVKNDNISSSVNVTVNEAYLADVVRVGDYVAYDAGSWTETKAKPTSQGQFGGYTEGQNKANSVAQCYLGTTTLKGWRVLSIDTSAKTVTLIHAGQSECYYHGQDTSSSVTKLNDRATSTYLNSSYADSAHMMNYNEALAITGNESDTDNTLRKTGDMYWLANAIYNNLRDVDSSGGMRHDGGYSMGVRPVVVLKSKILTTGLGTDKVGQEAWTLVKP